ncbi:MAG: putative oxidoreductase, aryl-alcohol dehydrogenase like protein [Acidobacteria bacterium]|nr:putative oxidoreductase, aryl-alcohol dehydrogenase like protein [Acidobacteriota bacterium]
MQKRKLGNSGLEVAPLAFGGNVFGWTVDESKSFALLDAFSEAGFDFIDTADIYSTWVPGNQGGESETIIGKWIKQKGNRHSVIIATKVGMEMGPGKKGLSRDYIFRAVEDSLRRLQTDYIDLYQSHEDDPATPLEETLSAFAELKQQGKVRAIGASNYKAERLAEALKVSEQLKIPRYESLQPHYNLYTRADFEEQLEPLCLEKGIGVIPYYALASGFLTGKYRSEADLAQSPRGRDIKKYLDLRGLRILKALDQVAEQYASTPARVALAWLIARPSITAPIASATSLGQLEDLIAATELVLDPAAIELLNEAGSYGESKGAGT